MTAELVMPAYALASLDLAALADMPELDRLILPYLLELWLRPDQWIDDSYPWRTWGFIAGRGRGKTHGIAAFINRAVESGKCKSPGLIAPEESRTRDVQVRALIDGAPPWFRPEEYRGSCVWPNGVFADAFTAESPGASRGFNLDLGWMTELVDWPSGGQMEAYKNFATATRKGAGRLLWDTTSKGTTPVIQHLLARAAESPETNILIRGSMFDNPLLSPDYMREVVTQYTGRRYEEEINGKVFDESAGALWMQRWINDHRVHESPARPDIRLVAVDPGMSTRADADPTGIVVGSRKARPSGGAECFIEDDLTNRYRPEDWGDIVVSQCADNYAAGVIVERNHAGDNPEYVIRTRAAERGLKTRVLGPNTPIPIRMPGVIYVKEVIAARSKSSRASGPAAATEQGRVHFVGVFEALEMQCTTWEPESSKSPNSLDALSYLVIELLGLDREKGGIDTNTTKEAAKATASTKANLGLGKLLGIGQRRPI